MGQGWGASALMLKAAQSEISIVAEICIFGSACTAWGLLFGIGAGRPRGSIFCPKCCSKSVLQHLLKAKRYTRETCTTLSYVLACAYVLDTRWVPRGKLVPACGQSLLACSGLSNSRQPKVG